MYLFCQNTLKTDREIIFEQTELGRLHKALPIKELSELFPKKKTTAGARSWFTPSGMVSLLFLQAYTKLSDRQFIDHINGNWQLQMFCGIQLPINQFISDRNLMSRIRKHVSEHIDLTQFQHILIKHWKPYMQNTHVGMCDATVYESHLRFPTDVKLLWESCQYIEGQLDEISKQLKEKHFNKTYRTKQKEYLAYARRRKKPYRQTKRMRKILLSFLQKLLFKLEGKLNKHVNRNIIISESVFEKMRTIKTIISQQKYLLTHKGSKISDRILSLHKPYVRAIVRGKDAKAVEFGAKVHMMQIDGINYIEHLSYNAFNESTRLKISVIKHKQLFGDCYQWAADGIYATNKNRTYLSAKNILNNFIPKGCPKNDRGEKLLKSLLNKERSTRLEGSFGTEKNYYGLAKVKARKESTEKLVIHFAVMTANAVRISKRMSCKEILQQAA